MRGGGPGEYLPGWHEWGNTQMPGHLPLDDVELIRRAAGCDEDAFCEVIERFDRHISSVVRRYASTRSDQEDLRSEIVAKLLSNDRRALRMWEPRASFGAYLATIAARHCMDWLSRRGRLPCTRLSNHDGADHDSVLEEIVAAERDSDPHCRFDQCRRLESLRQAIDRLSDDDRLVLYLRFDQELSGLEIADFLDVTHVAARQRVFRAVRRLEDQIRRLCPELVPPENRSDL